MGKKLGKLANLASIAIAAKGLYTTTPEDDVNSVYAKLENKVQISERRQRSENETQSNNDAHQNISSK